MVTGNPPTKDVSVVENLDDYDLEQAKCFEVGKIIIMLIHQMCES